LKTILTAMLLLLAACGDDSAPKQPPGKFQVTYFQRLDFGDLYELRDSETGGRYLVVRGWSDRPLSITGR
jgi:hypothetical protein